MCRQAHVAGAGMSGGRICVGAIAGAYGVTGELRVKSFCAEAADIAAYGPLTDAEGARSFTLRVTGKVPGGLRMRIDGVSTREQAEALRGTALHVERARLPETDEDEFYHADLIGLLVRDPGGEELGRVVAVHNHGAGDILELRLRKTGETLLLPFTRAVVPTVDVAHGVLVADPPGEVE